MTTSPQKVETEKSTAGRDERVVQQQKREQDDSWKTGVPDLLQQAESAQSACQPRKAIPSSKPLGTTKV
eukprot:1137710-Pelagomonas_calceolata.AAC.9